MRTMSPQPSARTGAKPEVVTLGEAMVLLVPTRRGLLRHATQFDRHVAGAESNLAVGLARLGHSVGWISRVGADEFGACILSFLRGEGVDVSRVAIHEDAPTGVFFKERRRAGLTRVFYYRSGSAASRIAPSDVDDDYVRQARCVHLTGVTAALGPEPLKALERVMSVAAEADVPIAFDPNVRLKLWSEHDARRTLLALLGGVRWFLASREEATLLTGHDAPELAARALLDRGPSVVVVRLGEEGALGVSADQVIRSPAIEVEVVETVGAGDAFNAGFLAAQLRGWPLDAALRLGNIVGGLATTVPGDVEGLPTWGEVQPYLGGPRVVDR